MFEDQYKLICSITNENDDEKLLALGKALSSPLRIRLLRELLHKTMTLVEIAHKFNISNSNALFHLSILEQADLVEANYVPSKKGIAKTYITSKRIFSCLFHMEQLVPRSIAIFEQSERVGNFIDADLTEFRFATKDRLFRPEIKELFSPERRQAELLWTKGAGFVEYAFSNAFCSKGEVKSISVSFEVCSETITYHRNWKSELTLSINGKEIGTYVSPGDFGERKGRLNPPSWPS